MRLTWQLLGDHCKTTSNSFNRMTKKCISGAMEEKRQGRGGGAAAAGWVFKSF